MKKLLTYKVTISLSIPSHHQNDLPKIRCAELLIDAYSKEEAILISGIHFGAMDVKQIECEIA